ncbi:hypothetical protein [Streptomyces xanthochromogenes]|uniref:hypothetical protein n=1 Tax=Streptomyces xanthochromogenes TaxID=67384 RepID=UPI003F4D6435
MALIWSPVSDAQQGTSGLYQLVPGEADVFLALSRAGGRVAGQGETVHEAGDVGEGAVVATDGEALEPGDRGGKVVFSAADGLVEREAELGVPDQVGKAGGLRFSLQRACPVHDPWVAAAVLQHGHVGEDAVGALVKAVQELLHEGQSVSGTTWICERGHWALVPGSRAEPGDEDCESDGAEVDVGALLVVGGDGAEAHEAVDGAFDGVASLVSLDVASRFSCANEALALASWAVSFAADKGFTAECTYLTGGAVAVPCAVGGMAVGEAAESAHDDATS